ncbi:hypothetical protein [Paucibacter sp. M5-1]|uniref:hypothetical protein n=1 Tax=Paucibacter sp. M5-1 TaxID=3015998 RepID=UPI0022B8A841|nr:hypothetical protein [Paucibacter sp. M5-1]MCZ7884629.1 hypothetical protein [Paucibacter sp. M5-1]
MAAWQFDLGFSRAPGGTNFPPSFRPQVEAGLRNVDVVSSKMLDGWTVNGDELGNRIDLVANDDGEFELAARLDARAATTDQFVAQLCDLAASLGCKLQSDGLESTLEPRPDVVKQALQKSSAWRYALDPAGIRP